MASPGPRKPTTGVMFEPFQVVPERPGGLQTTCSSIQRFLEASKPSFCRSNASWRPPNHYHCRSKASWLPWLRACKQTPTSAYKHKRMATHGYEVRPTHWAAKPVDLDLRHHATHPLTRHTTGRIGLSGIREAVTIKKSGCGRPKK